MRLVIVGASGMVGGYALRYMLDHFGIGRITSIGRKKLPISHPRLEEVLHQDFSDCSSLTPATSGQDACLFCLGTYTGTVPDEELRMITVDYTVEFARVLRRSSPDAIRVLGHAHRQLLELPAVEFKRAPGASL